MPADYTGVRLELARQREQGAPLTDAWPQAVQMLPVISGKGADAIERRWARAAQLDARTAWRDAYELRPSTPGTESA
jgi:hypothetical protein